MQALHDLIGLRMQCSLGGCIDEDNHLIAKGGDALMALHGTCFCVALGGGDLEACLL